MFKHNFRRGALDRFGVADFEELDLLRVLRVDEIEVDVGPFGKDWRADAPDGADATKALFVSSVDGPRRGHDLNAVADA